MKYTKKVEEELKKLKERKEKINTSDIPEITNFKNYRVGEFYKPIKKSITLRLDADMLEWFKQTGKGYQTRINDLLRSEFIKNAHK